MNKPVITAKIAQIKRPTVMIIEPLSKNTNYISLQTKLSSSATVFLGHSNKQAASN